MITLETKNHLNNLINEQLKNHLYHLNEIIDFKPPEYIEDWNKEFEIVKLGSSGKEQEYHRPNKPYSNFKFSFKTKNILKLDSDSKGIYFFEGTEIKFFYVGQTDENLNQRFDAHIQKLTTTNNKKGYTPEAWKQIGIDRYERLKEKSVYLDDIKITFMNIRMFDNIVDTNNVKEALDKLETIIYFYFKKNLPEHKILNTESSVGTKEFRLRYKDYWGR